MMMPEAFVLAAGNSTRLGGDVPKPLRQLGGVPVLVWNLAMLARAKVPRAVLNWSAPQDVTALPEVGRDPCINVVYEAPDALLGTAGPIAWCFKSAPRRLIVVYGDQLTQADLPKMLAQHEGSGLAVTMLVFDGHAGRNSGPVGGWVELDGLRVAALHETRGAPPPRRTSWANGGVYIIEPEVVAGLPDGPSDWCRDVFPAMIARGEVGAFLHDGWVWSIDTPEAYARAVLLWEGVSRPW